MLNTITIQGRLTKNPESKTIPSGTALCSFTIASERPKKKDGDQQTDFIPCIAWAKTAEFMQKYFHKGDMIIVSGRLQSRQYEGQDGKNHLAYEVSISEANFCGGKKPETPAAHCQPSMQADYDSINWDEIPNLPEEF
jgi:single-strand DNA-binding protein